jgi:ferric-dicitrate binding protein FerR (iron transport regulator)
MEQDNQRLWELLAAFQHGELTPEEQAELELLKNGYPDELASSAKIKSGLDQLSGLTPPLQTFSWFSIDARIRRRKVRKLVVFSLKYAAIVLVSITIGYLLRNMPAFTPPGQLATVEVQYGQTGHVFLFDGTEVWLNSGSKLQYPSHFNAQSRDVYLEGEAFFKVTHNEKLPFKVKTPKMEVEVLGTSFNVNAYNDAPNIAVVLEEGKVRLNKPGGEKIAEIAPGEKAELSRKSNTLSIEKVDTQYYTDWKNGSLEFKHETLGEIAQKLERWYNVEIRTGSANYAGF